ncbi:MAG: bifunctional pyr operon transcriptional regulator/uracil phosphoribosyltransferase PyrR [Candidatus Aminicenantes bacterium]|nr:bifunctional pyr operon transcriptional regulator/uracil phosphoribosyltransferase PyrR [Candidatus Aminicenantes bacterium]
MGDKVKATVMDANKIRRTLYRMATEIIERNRNLKNLAVVGIRTRGVHVASRIAALIKEFEGVAVPVGVMDITGYRDDRAVAKTPTKAAKPRLGFAVDKKTVLLVDDVLFTGRTIRAAMGSLFDQGRPQAIQLLVLVDRGHRELPIRADYVGKYLPTSRRERVRVRLREVDHKDEVLITESVDLKKKT